MDFVTVRELRAESDKVWDRVAAGEEIVITRDGKPFALLVHTEPTELEDKLRALRLHAFDRAWQALGQQAQAGGLAELGEADIQAEIDAVRGERRASGGA